MAGPQISEGLGLLEQKLRNRIRAKVHVCSSKGLRAPNTRPKQSRDEVERGNTEPLKPSGQELGPPKLVPRLALLRPGLLTASLCPKTGQRPSFLVEKWKANARKWRGIPYSLAT